MKGGTEGFASASCGWSVSRLRLYLVVAALFAAVAFFFAVAAAKAALAVVPVFAAIRTAPAVLAVSPAALGEPPNPHGRVRYVARRVGSDPPGPQLHFPHPLLELLGAAG